MSGSDAKVIGQMAERFDEVLTPEAIAFVADLQKKFGPTREQLLARRQQRRQQAADTGKLYFLDETKDVRADTSWRVAELADLKDRRVEITGPTERKMLINALNSGAKVFMADFEDANTPNWANMIQGQLNLTDAIERRIDFTSPEGKDYKLKDTVATLMPRPRGWHLPEKHFLVDDAPISGSLFDFGLFFFHNAKRLMDKGTRPYFYLPKLESHLEARLWNDVFNHAQDALGVPRGSVRATVLIETILAAFEMEEILYELRTHSSGLNAGRWDYIFSMIKKFRDRPDVVLPDRVRVNVSVGIQYIESWLRGVGAAAINNLMEDVATAEISRSQVWQWVRHASRLADGQTVTPDLVREIADDEMVKIRQRLGDDLWSKGRFEQARKAFEEVALAEEFPVFLTLVAQKYLD